MEYKRLTDENCCEICEIVNGAPCDNKDECMRYRLKILEDKIENETLIELSCKVGSYIYRVTSDKRKKEPDKCEVVGMWLSEDVKSLQVHLYCIKGDDNWYSISLPASEFGKSLFLTKEQAKAKLKELKSKE